MSDEDELKRTLVWAWGIGAATFALGAATFGAGYVIGSKRELREEPPGPPVELRLKVEAPELHVQEAPVTFTLREREVKVVELPSEGVPDVQVHANVSVGRVDANGPITATGPIELRPPSPPRASVTHEEVNDRDESGKLLPPPKGAQAE